MGTTPGNEFGRFFFVVGIVVVVTLITLPYAGPFFAAALAGGATIAFLIALWHRRRRL